MFHLIRLYYPSVTRGEFRRWSMFDLDDALEAMTERAFREGYPTYALLQSLLNMFKGKDGKMVELKEVLAPFANPFKDDRENDYDAESRRLMRKAIDAGVVPEWCLSLIELDKVYDEVGA